MSFKICLRCQTKLTKHENFGTEKYPLCYTCSHASERCRRCNIPLLNINEKVIAAEGFYCPRCGAELKKKGCVAGIIN